MTWYKTATLSKDEITKIEKEMLDFFKKRTNLHIDLVRKYCQKISDYDKERFGELVERGKVHDDSKFKDPEKEPYIYITWQYKCKDDGEKFEISEDMKEKMNAATNHHVCKNKHHPEFYCGEKIGLINREDRDEPRKLIDATNMPDLSLAEMVADWCAMSEEKKSNPKDWADKNVNIRWKFTDEQKDLIYELIDEVWE
jgi:hypothetical protein